ncbi:LuxR C-terminal-related transcriptional regulator [Rhizobium sp. WW_1]|jgi:DNA-binding NarL/FixJ family response regulator|uniref:sigma factor-like helix-turn-helix DNA-binding protein n=1 Tax=Rhizobium sp. WW_1 TaxID=1907375 RepID=UPI000648DFBA|nr:LuxR C-terminal-related transcriptional regulator [Rhizobium sp. WW_1]RKD68989.1 regulatory LuxR family protein [Rhizobium sp. WW_1]
MTCPLRQSEIIIVQRLADGKMMKEIAAEIGISIAAVHNRVERARSRENLGNTVTAVVATALRCGWIH